MRVLLTLIVALTAFTSLPSLAHPGGHGEMRWKSAKNKRWI